MMKTKFRVVMRSAQPEVPAFERRIRLFLEDGTEIHGLIALAVDGGDLDDVGVRQSVRVKLEFDGDQFVVERMTHNAELTGTRVNHRSTE